MLVTLTGVLYPIVCGVLCVAAGQVRLDSWRQSARELASGSDVWSRLCDYDSSNLR